MTIIKYEKGIVNVERGYDPGARRGALRESPNNLSYLEPIQERNLTEFLDNSNRVGLAD